MALTWLSAGYFDCLYLPSGNRKKHTGGLYLDTHTSVCQTGGFPAATSPQKRLQTPERNNNSVTVQHFKLREAVTVGLRESELYVVLIV